MFAQQLGVGGQAQMGIDDDGLRILSLGEAHGEAGIVGEDGADAHEDGVVGGAQRVCPLERFGGTDGERLAGLRRDGAIEALGVAQGDQGPSCALVMVGGAGAARRTGGRGSPAGGRRCGRRPVRHHR
ncbi:MAG: hypothetical protein R2873_01070 [Caldilineaceae bacterium]